MYLLGALFSVMIAVACGGDRSEALPAPATADPRLATAEPVDPSLPEVVRPLPAGLAGQIVFQSDREGRPRLYVLDLPQGTVRRVGDSGPWFDEEPKWSPDGQRIAFSSTRAGNRNVDIYVMNADGSNIVRLTEHEAAEQDPTWAADGQSLFFTGERDGRNEIYRVWLADRRVERVTSGFNRAIMPAASPDGKRLAFASQMLVGFQIHLLDLATGTSTQITSGGGACRPEWAPDSQELAFTRIAQEPSRLETIRETGTQVVIEDRKLWSYYPDYSPDGRYIAFSVSPEHHRGEDWDLAVMDRAKPGAFTKLTQGRGNDRVPDWRPVMRPVSAAR